LSYDERLYDLKNFWLIPITNAGESIDDLSHVVDSVRCRAVCYDVFCSLYWRSKHISLFHFE